MSDQEIRVGDRFEALCDFSGGVQRGQIVEVCAPTTHPLAWICKCPSSGVPLAGSFVLALTHGCWRRVPREATIEERRAALKVGDRITDPALLGRGMRIQGGGMICGRMIGDNGRPTEGGYNFDHHAAGWKNLVEKDGVTFLGWDPDFETTEATLAPEAPICDAERCEAHHDPSDPACIRAKHRTPRPVLPFVRHLACKDPHTEPTLCLSCESLIHEEVDQQDEVVREFRRGKRVFEPGPPPGATVGPVLARLR